MKIKIAESVPVDRVALLRDPLWKYWVMGLGHNLYDEVEIIAATFHGGQLRHIHELQMVATCPDGKFVSVILRSTTVEGRIGNSEVTKVSMEIRVSPHNPEERAC